MNLFNLWNQIPNSFILKFTYILRQLIESVLSLIVFMHSQSSIDQILISLASLLPLTILESKLKH